MNNYNDMIGTKVYTDAGEYIIVSHVYDDGNSDQSVNLYVGRSSDGHHDMIASDNASFWVVGTEDDAVLNHDQFAIIAERCSVKDVISAVQPIDVDLANWLLDRYDDANTILLVGDRAEYDRDGNSALIRYYRTSAHDIYDAIADRWDDIAVDDVIMLGVTSPELVHFAEVDDRIRSIDGLTDLNADYYAAPYSTDGGDGDCADWEFYNVAGLRFPY